MSLIQQFLYKARGLLYKHYQSTKLKYEQISRILMRNQASEENPVNSAAQITNRINDDRWKDIKPVWVLSTGRTGSNSLTELLKLSPFLDAFHEPAPELFQFSYAYAMNKIHRNIALKTLGYLRDELVFRSIRDGQVYVETNNRVTYIADLLLELYPSSRFIHIYRNPYDFIRSGMRRNYYNGHMRDYARLRPNNQDAIHQQWEDFSNLQKVAWNWTIVNERCLNFKASLSENQVMSLSSESLFQADPSLIYSLFSFAGSKAFHPPKAEINKVMETKHNAQNKGQFANPKDWNSGQIEQVNDIIAPIASKLGYQLMSVQNNGNK